MSELLRQVRRGLSKAAEEAERLGKVGRLKLEITRLRGRRRQALRKAGEAVLALVDAGALTVPPDVEEHLAAARTADRDIAGRRAEIELLRARPQTDAPASAAAGEADPQAPGAVPEGG